MTASAVPDSTDKQILRILQDDGRTPVAEIARRVKLAETTIRYRINRLRRRGAISRFTALLNPRYVGLPVSAILLVKADPSRLGDVFADLSGVHEATHIVQTTGEFDMVTVVHARDMEHMNRVANRVKQLPGVRDTHIWLATGLVKIDTRYHIT